MGCCEPAVDKSCLPNTDCHIKRVECLRNCVTSLCTRLEKVRWARAICIFAPPYMVWWSIVYTMLGRNQTLWWAVKCSNKQGITWRQKVSFWIERLWSGRGKKLGKSTVRERWLSLRHYQGALMLKRWQWPKNLGDVAALNTVFRLRKVDRIRLLKIYFEHTSMQNTQGIESEAPSGCIGYIATR